MKKNKEELTTLELNMILDVLSLYTLPKPLNADDRRELGAFKSGLKKLNKEFNRKLKINLNKIQN